MFSGAFRTKRFRHSLVVVIGPCEPRGVLCDSGVRAVLVFGEEDEIGLTDDEGDLLDHCSSVSVVTIADAGHFTLNQKPGEIADILLDAVKE
jgi:pimeloyl-ACP methyl ester carboxylesterase